MVGAVDQVATGGPRDPNDEIEARYEPGGYRHRFQQAIPTIPFFKSIRFRLTAWYALAFMIVIVALAFALHSLLVRSLTMDSESRLRNAADEIADRTSAFRTADGQIVAGSLRGPDLNSVVLSGLWFQLYDPDRAPVALNASGSLSEPPADLVSAIDAEDLLAIDHQEFRTIEIGSDKSLIFVTPLAANGELVGWVVVGEPLGSRNNIIEVVDQVLRVFGVAGVALAVWGGWLLAGRALAPVDRITRIADSIASSEGAVSLSRRLDVPEAGDELTKLAYTFNVMLDRIESAFLSQRRFVGDASHELRTPLTAVRGNVDVLIRQLRSGRPVETADVLEELAIVQRESARMGRLIEDMLALARSDASSQGDLLKTQAVSLEILANEAFRTASQVATGQEMRLEVVEPVMVYGDGDRLVQVMIILLDNAIRHTPAGKEIALVVDRAMDAEAEDQVLCARIRVSDQGAGIATEHVPHLFERFYRAEDARSRASGGTGLGLSIALSIVRGHGGWIDVDTKLDAGTTFTVWLPLEPEAVPDLELTNGSIRERIMSRLPGGTSEESPGQQDDSAGS